MKKINYTLLGANYTLLGANYTLLGANYTLLGAKNKKKTKIIRWLFLKKVNKNPL